MEERRRFALVLPLVGMLVLCACASVGSASAKFAETSEISDQGSLVVTFQEGSLKRFSAVDYSLQATASAVWDAGGGQSIGVLYDDPPLGDATQLAPDGKGRVSGVMQLDVPRPGGGICTCGDLLHVEYSDVTLTNLTTGRVYRLDPESRDLP